MMLYVKKMLKKDKSINIENINLLKSEFITESILLNGKKPPEEIIVRAKLSESKVLKFINLRIKKINKVIPLYKIKTLIDCFINSFELNDKKLVRDFFKLLSKISIKRTIENKKYNPPIHWDEDLHKIKLSSKCFILLKIVKPVDVKPETASK